jgi:hypothetical protein
MLAGAAARVPAAPPVPEIGTMRLGSDPSLVNVRLALVLPADFGAKTTLNDVLLPAAKVRGRLRPLRLKPDPENAA